MLGSRQSFGWHYDCSNSRERLGAQEIARFSAVQPKESKMKMFHYGALFAALLSANLYGQQTLGIDPPNPQTAPATQNAGNTQDSQATDLQNQPGLLDSRQSEPVDTANQTQNQLAPPQQYDRSNRLQQDAAPTDRDRSMMRDTQRQSGTPGSGRPGELGVFLVDADGPGVMIRQTVVGSAADEAGLEPGDVILRINGQSVEMPPEVTRLVRAIPGGESVTLHIWRDGAEQEIGATLQPAGERYQVGFRGTESTALNANDDLGARTRRLEQQLTMVMQELQQLREEVRQLNTGRARTPLNQSGIDVSQPGATPPNGAQRGLEAIPPDPTETGGTQGQNPPAENDTGLPF
jgi:membrane-associated protease RseP (regulator of RpoE activity)